MVCVVADNVTVLAWAYLDSNTNCILFPNVETLGAEALKGACFNYIELPASLHSIGESAFADEIGRASCRERV